MIHAPWHMFASELSHTFLRTKGLAKFIYSITFANYRIATIGTWDLDAITAGAIPASKGAILLLGMIARWHEKIFAETARLFFALCTVFIRAKHGTKLHHPIRSFVNMFSATLTFNHNTIIP